LPGAAAGPSPAIGGVGGAGGGSGAAWLRVHAEFLFVLNSRLVEDVLRGEN